MSWIPLHHTLARHPKTRAACELLHVTRATLVGHLGFLWIAALDFSKDGYLTGITDEAVADYAEWEGNPTDFVAALTAVGFLDEDRRIHDWEEYGGKLTRQQRSNAERQKAFREKNRPTAPPDEDSNSYVTVTSPLRHAHSNAPGPVMSPLRSAAIQAIPVPEVDTSPESSVTVMSRARGEERRVEEIRSEESAHALRAGVGASAREDEQEDVPEQGPTQAPPPEESAKAWADRTFKAYCASYPKPVPKELRPRWPKYCPDPDTFTAIMAGLARWCQSRQWVKDGPSFATGPERFVSEKVYLIPPIPYSTPAQEARHAESQRGTGNRRGQHAARRHAGSVDDDYWNHDTGLLAGTIPDLPPAHEAATPARRTAH